MVSLVKSSLLRTTPVPSAKEKALRKVQTWTLVVLVTVMGSFEKHDKASWGLCRQSASVIPVTEQVKFQKNVVQTVLELV